MNIESNKRYYPKHIAQVMGVHRLTIYSWYKKGRMFLRVDPHNNYFWLYGHELLSEYKKTYGEDYEAATSHTEHS